MSRSLAGSGSSEVHSAWADSPHAKTTSSSRFIRRVRRFFSAGLIAYQQGIVNQNAQSSTYVDDRSAASASASWAAGVRNGSATSRPAKSEGIGEASVT